MSINAIFPILFSFCIFFALVSTTKNAVQAKEKSCQRKVTLDYLLHGSEALPGIFDASIDFFRLPVIEGCYLPQGPYVNVVKRFEKCQNVIKPYPKDPIGVFTIEMTKNKLVKGNLTVLRKNSNFQALVQEFYYEDGHWELSFANKFSCRYKWLAVLMDLLRIQYDKKNCGVPKGTFLFEVDINVIDHVWMPTREYGRMLRHIEVNSKDGTFICFEVECDVNPIK